MKDTFTMKELAAILVRRGKTILIFAVVFALLLGGWRGFSLAESANAPENTPEEIEARYQKALAAYHTEKSSLKERIATKQQLLDKQVAYTEESLLMDIDPLNKAVSKIHLMVSGLNIEELQQAFPLDSVDYAISRIQTQYALYWDSLDLSAMLADTPFRHMNEKYIREVATFTSSPDSYMTIEVASDDVETSRQVAQLILNALLEYQEIAVKNTFAHHLYLVSQTSKIEIDENLESLQNSNLKKVDTYQTDLQALENALEKLTAPVRGELPIAGTFLKGAIKYSVLGAALGVVLSVVFIMLSYLFRNRPELSRHMKKVLSVPMLGSAVKTKGLFGGLADRILGERIWKDDAQALLYLTANAKAQLPENASVAVLSTLPNSQDLPQVQSVLEALRSQGFTVCFAEDASRNPQAVSAMQESSCVVLAERCGVSSWNALEEICALAKELDVPVKGFLLI